MIACDRVARGFHMTPTLLVSGLTALGLLIYLFVALLKPEWFG